MHNNVVRFGVTVEVFSCCSRVKPPSRPLSITRSQQPAMVLSGLMHRMYKERLHSDVTLICEHMRIRAHKCILSHASPVFKSMFAHNMVESSTNEVRMDNWEPQTVCKMVEFLYTAKINLEQFGFMPMVSASLAKRATTGTSVGGKSPGQR